MVTVAGKVPFLDLCKVCEKICLKKGTEAKKKPLADFLTAWRDFHNKYHKNDPTTTEDSFFPAMRLLLPQFEKERSAYGIKETTLAKLYIEILTLNKESTDAQKLLNYRNPHTSKANAGDFATVAYFILKNRCPEIGTLTIAEVNADLDGVATSHANKNKIGVKKHLLHLLRNTSAMEQKWLIRMIMKELKFGLSEQSILGLFHPDAKDLYDVTNNLQKVCLSLRNPEIRLHEIEISIFAPFRPMLAERASPEKIERLMKNMNYYIETKHDGERMQLHKKGDEFKYFSRNGNEYTSSYGSNRLEGNLTPYIADLFNKTVKECILDGEMMGFDSNTNCMGTKAENFDVKALRDDGQYQPCFFIFDILLHNGKVLTNLPLKERLGYITDLVKPKEGRLMLTNRFEGVTNQDAADALNLAIDKREEGIVIKDPNSVYRPNTRKGGWYKMKPDYVDSLMDQLDLIIIGGYFGEGHRSGIISHFLLAVAVPPKAGEEHPTEFHSITKVGSGYTMAELHELCQKLSEHWKPYDKRKPPRSIVLASGHRERPDLWVEPSNSYLVQVKAAEFMESNQFKTGYTLRFPRVEKVRYDKPWYQCMTTLEVEEFKKLGKLANKHVLLGEDGEEGAESTKKRKKAKVEQPIALAPQFQAIDTSAVTKVSQLFEGKEFCVLNGANHSKQELEKLVIENGGSLVQNPGSKTFSVIADNKTLRVSNLIKAKMYDVVKSSWLLDCISSNIILRSPNHFIHMSPNTAKLLSEDFDKFGDSYTEHLTVESLKQLFSSMPVEETLTPSEIYEIEQQYFPNTSPNGLFRLCEVYLDLYLELDNPDSKLLISPLELTKSALIFGGANISEKLHNKITHVIIDSKDMERLDEFRKLNRLRKKKFHLVNDEWVTDSVANATLMNETRYQP